MSAEGNDKRKSGSRPSKAPSQYRFTFTRAHHKSMLGILCGVVVVTFVLGYSPRFLAGCETTDRPGRRQAVGTLGGAKVTDDELRHAERNVRISLREMGIDRDASERFAKRTRAMACRNLAASRFCEKLGIRTGDKELQDAIRRRFSTKDDAFSPQAYREILRGIGTTVDEYEPYLHDRLTAAKLQYAIGAASWIAPHELWKEISRNTDQYTAEYVVLPARIFAPGVKVTDDEARAYYQANTNKFLVNEKRRVKYVRFPTAAYLSNVSVTDAEAMDYYKDNGKEYTVADTNGIESLKPFEDVSVEIKGTLAAQGALDLAERSAMNFVMELLPEDEAKRRSFEESAAAARVAVRTSEYFAVDEPAGLSVPLEVSKEAFSLIPGDSERSFSNPIRDTNDVFVIALAGRQEKHVPEFEAVMARAKTLAEMDKVRRLLNEKAEKVHDTVRDAMKSGKSFADAVKPFELNPARTESFSSFSPLTNVVNAEELMEAVASRRQGEITDPVPWTNGLAIAYVSKRESSEAGMDQRLVPYLSESLRQQRTRLLYHEWETRLVSTNELKALVAEGEEAAAAPAEGEDESPAAD